MVMNIMEIGSVTNFQVKANSSGSKTIPPSFRFFLESITSKRTEYKIKISSIRTLRRGPSTKVPSTVENSTLMEISTSRLITLAIENSTRRVISRVSRTIDIRSILRIRLLMGRASSFLLRASSIKVSGREISFMEMAS